MAKEKASDFKNFIALSLIFATFVAIWAYAGHLNALTFLAVSGTTYTVIGFIGKARKLPRPDRNLQFHSTSNGQFVQHKQVYSYYGAFGLSIVILIAARADSLAQALPFFSSLPVEVQALYAIGTHGLGYALS